MNGVIGTGSGSVNGSGSGSGSGSGGNGDARGNSSGVTTVGVGEPSRNKTKTPQSSNKDEEGKYTNGMLQNGLRKDNDVPLSSTKRLDGMADGDSPAKHRSRRSENGCVSGSGGSGSGSAEAAAKKTSEKRGHDSMLGTHTTSEGYGKDGNEYCNGTMSPLANGHGHHHHYHHHHHHHHHKVKKKNGFLPNRQSKDNKTVTGSDNDSDSEDQASQRRQQFSNNGASSGSQKGKGRTNGMVDRDKNGMRRDSNNSCNSRVENERCSGSTGKDRNDLKRGGTPQNGQIPSDKPKLNGVLSHNDVETRQDLNTNGIADMNTNGVSDNGYHHHHKRARQR